MSADNYQPAFLNVDVRDGILVIELLPQHLTDEDNIEQLGQELFTLSERHANADIVIRLDRITYATSSVLGKMITLHRRLHRSGSRLVLCGAHGTMLDILRTSRLVQYFEIAEDLPAALTLLEESP